MSDKNILIILLIFFCINLFSEEVPKKIIAIEENLELDQIDANKNDKQLEGDINLEKKTNDVDSENDKNLIVIDDIPNEFNEWFGILSSNQGGLGWLMWGSTDNVMATNILEATNFATESPTMFKLTSKILMSRAQKPKEKKLDGINIQSNKDRKLKYFKSKIRVLGEMGDSKNIEQLIDNIPLEIKDDNFYDLVFNLRQTDKDIPYICNELQKKKFDVQKDIEKRKTLIACIIAKEKYGQAQLALDLLENDSTESLPYIRKIRSFLEKPSVNNLLLDEKSLTNRNFKIISLSNYEIAKKIFSENSSTLSKIIFDMKLYSIKDQIEALEKLVSIGVYDPMILKNAYDDYYLKIKDTVNQENLIKVENENTLDIRVSLLHLINNTSSDQDRAKLLNLLWLKGQEINIENALYSITISSINSLTPKRDLSWFIYPVTRALISNKKFEEAKKWLFFISNDFKDRAVLDLNFCKMLLLLHIGDADLKKSNYEIPDVDFLLNILDNSLEVKKESIYFIMVTLKALNFDVSSNLWNSFYMNIYKNFSNKSNANKTFLFFTLEDSLKKRNLAETVFAVIDLMNSSSNEKYNFYYLYRSIYSLNNIGLREYARELGLEINMDL